MRQARARKPMLFALVSGVFLVLVGTTASALVMVTSDHLASSMLTAYVSRDGAIVELYLNRPLTVDGALTVADLREPTTPEAARRADDLEAGLATLVNEAGIARIDVRDAHGIVLLSSAAETRGSSDASASAWSSVDIKPTAVFVSASDDAITSALGLDGAVRELLPMRAGSSEGEAVAAVAIWRDSAPILERLDVARRDVMLVTLAAGILLAGVLFVLFRSAHTRLIRQHSQLMEATRRDALTGTLNHGAIVALLAEAVEAARAAEQQIGVALVDVDNFRLFNDVHGHEAGDEILRRVAMHVEPFGAAGHVARYGPDEFLIIRAGADASTMEQLMAELRGALADESVQFGDSERLPISISAGVCVYPDHAASVTELLSMGAIAVGEAKASGGDTVRVARVGEEEAVASGSFDVLQGLVIAVDTKDRYTKRHSEDVARYAVFLAERMGLDEEFRHTLHLAGLLHDVGKIGIPDVILRKPSKLTAEEYGMFQRHVALGDAIVRDVPNVDVVREGIRHHHERWDGKGYLEGLEGEAIPLIGRMLAVADAFSAMTTTRPYRKALPIEEALKRLGDAAGTQLQEDLVAAFIAGIESDPAAPLPGDESPRIWTPQALVA